MPARRARAATVRSTRLSESRLYPAIPHKVLGNCEATVRPLIFLDASAGREVSPTTCKGIPAPRTSVGGGAQRPSAKADQGKGSGGTGSPSTDRGPTQQKVDG